MENKSAKISITFNADEALGRMLQLVNDGFEGGKVSKQDLTSWLVLYCERNSFESCIADIRKDHFDQLAYLESLVNKIKEARKTGEEVADIQPLLAPLTAKRKNTKPVPQEDILPKT